MTQRQEPGLWTPACRWDGQTSVLMLYRVGGSSRTYVLVLLMWHSLLQMLTAALSPFSPYPRWTSLKLRLLPTEHTDLKHPAVAQLNSVHLLTPVSIDGDGCPLLNAMLIIHIFPVMSILHLKEKGLIPPVFGVCACLLALLGYLSFLDILISVFLVLMESMDYPQHPLTPHIYDEVPCPWRVCRTHSLLVDYNHTCVYLAQSLPLDKMSRIVLLNIKCWTEYRNAIWLSC